MKNIEFSIIVPVYEAEKWIGRCIESLLQQSYDRAEIILIDDGSKDNSLSICRKYESVNPKIRVFSQENHGVSYTRNRGIAYSTGDYILFVDADDEVREDLLENIVLRVKHRACDIFFWGYKSCFKQSYRDFEILPKCGNAYFERAQLEDYFWDLFALNLTHNIGTKAYKRQLIVDNHIQFAEDLSYSEDALFCVNCIENANDFCVLDSAAYIYHLEENQWSLNSGYRKSYMDGIWRLYASLKELPMEEQCNRFLVNQIPGICLNELYIPQNRAGCLDIMQKISRDETAKQAYKSVGSADPVTNLIMTKQFDKAFRIIKKRVQKEAFRNSGVYCSVEDTIHLVGRKLKRYIRYGKRG